MRWSASSEITSTSHRVTRWATLDEVIDISRETARSSLNTNKCPKCIQPLDIATTYVDYKVNQEKYKEKDISSK